MRCDFCQERLFARSPLAIIVIAQLFGTSLWFSVNGVGLSLARELGLTDAGLGALTTATQAGFITGTLLIAATGLADRVRASRLFPLAALAGALANAGFIVLAAHWPTALFLRFFTGFCLAGVYPLGMKLVISWTPQHTGAALAWLVGMLTLGTAFPHLLRGTMAGLAWEWPMLAASGLAVVAAALIFRLGDGPHLPSAGGKRRLIEGFAAFRNGDFRAAAFGYFGHSWELYAFWMLAPFLAAREIARLEWPGSILPWFAFAIIAVGLLGCVGGGAVSRRLGNLFVARWALTASGSICLAYPLLGNAPPWFMILLLVAWGVTVIADSPQFSALAAATAPRDRIGSTLAIMNAIGFALTIPAISITSAFWSQMEQTVAWLLLPGPVLGVLSLRTMRLDLSSESVDTFPKNIPEDVGCDA